jgi:lysozyme
MRVVFVALVALVFAPAAFAQIYIPRTERHVSQSQIDNFGLSLGIAHTGSARGLEPLPVAILKAFEGWEPLPYNDPIYCTVGYGHLLALKKCEELDPLPYTPDGLSLPDGEKLLEADSVSARLGVQQLVKVDLNDAQFGALTLFAYNVGLRNFGKSKMLALLNQNRFDLAANEFPRWVKQRDKVLRGLVKRRACERELFLGTASFNSDGIFEPESCSGLGIASDSEVELIDVDTGT